MFSFMLMPLTMTGHGIEHIGQMPMAYRWNRA